MLLYPYLMINDFSLYKDIINPYFPLLNVVLYLTMALFGVSVSSLKGLTLLVIIITNITIFGLVYQKTKSQLSASMASIYYIFLSFGLGANGLWYELFIAPLILVGLVLFIEAKGKSHYLLSGVLFTLAILSKQNAIYLIAPVLIYGFLTRRFWELVMVLLPIGLGLVGLLVIIQQIDLWDSFTKWAIILPITFSSQPGFNLFPTIRQSLLFLVPMLPILGLLSTKINLKTKLFWGSALTISLLFALPRFEDFHLQVAVVISAYLVGILMSFRWQMILVIIALIFLGLTQLNNLGKEDRFLDQQMLEIASQLKNYSSVYLVNLPELAYIYGDRLPPKPWATNFPWYFENIDQSTFNLEKQSPEVILLGFKQGGDFYDLGNYIPTQIDQFITAYYKQESQNQFYKVYTRK
jgi:hypothetical protein